MRKARALVAIFVAAPLVPAALPADAKSPPRNDVARLRHQVVVLKANVQKLRATNRQLAQANAVELRHELALQRRVAAVDPCPITRPNEASRPVPPSAPSSMATGRSGSVSGTRTSSSGTPSPTERSR